MDKIKIIRHIIGYIIGMTVFVILVPYGLIKFSRLFGSFGEAGFLHPDWLRLTIAAVFLTIGLIFALWSNAALFIIGRGGPADGFNVAISPRSEKLVVTGPYRYTRNPMVFGAYMIYFSVALYMNSLACLGLLIFFYGLSIIYLKLTEEKRLYHDFGDDYLDYQKKVSMIIPFPRKGY
ncbi:MAG: isoprenylcysteine carboxylmethyltransferase family protein [Deltaproteobacteria bacterium]|nr:isoprenylcysteine carboxylmethyltransferase family protein [Deltaproteobacteria bacterium]